MKKYSQLKADIILDFYLDEICKFRNYKKSDVLKKGRKREYTDVRAIVTYLAKKQFSKIGLREFANFFNLKNHATVLYSVTKIENLKNQDWDIKRTLEHCEKLDFVSAILENNGFLPTAFNYLLNKTDVALTFETFATPNTKGCATYYKKTELGENTVYGEVWNVDNIDIFDAIIISKNINSNPLGILINSLKN